MTSDALMLITARSVAGYGVEKMNVWTPQGWQEPPGFPPRVLMREFSDGGSTWSVTVLALIKYLEEKY